MPSSRFTHCNKRPSEEALPQLGKILAKHHGFKCTVLFAIDPKTGIINPNVNNNSPAWKHSRRPI